MVGGTNGVDILQTVHSFDPVRLLWNQRANLLEKRCYVSTAALDDILYAMGGHNGNHRINTCETYNPETNTWSFITPMNVARSDACAAVLRGKIYIAGGLNDQVVESSVEVFDRNGSTWTMITPMNSPRTSLRVINYHETLYVIGGNNGVERSGNMKRNILINKKSNNYFYLQIANCGKVWHGSRRVACCRRNENSKKYICSLRSWRLYLCNRRL